MHVDCSVVAVVYDYEKGLGSRRRVDYSGWRRHVVDGAQVSRGLAGEHQGRPVRGAVVQAAARV